VRDITIATIPDTTCTELCNTDTVNTPTNAAVELCPPHVLSPYRQVTSGTDPNNPRLGFTDPPWTLIGLYTHGRLRAQPG